MEFLTACIRPFLFTELVEMGSHTACSGGLALHRSAKAHSAWLSPKHLTPVKGLEDEAGMEIWRRKNRQAVGFTWMISPRGVF